MRRGFAEIALDDEVELADIGGQERRAQHVIGIRLARLGQQVLELAGEAQHEIAELHVLGIALLQRRHDVAILEAQQTPGKGGPVAFLVAAPHFVRHIGIEQAVHVEGEAVELGHQVGGGAQETLALGLLLDIAE